MELSKAPLSPHLDRARSEINVTDEINSSILANIVIPMFLSTSNCHIFPHDYYIKWKSLKIKKLIFFYL